LMNQKNGCEKQMKKMTYINLLVMLILTLAAFTKNDSEKNSAVETNKHQTSIKESTKPYVRGIGNVDVLQYQWRY
ncbi:MAG TPA: hypothetical protein VJ546_04725, partial [Bacillales bacterium]|nr:hypothetical protein [Bacillales bacterium]